MLTYFSRNNKLIVSISVYRHNSMNYLKAFLFLLLAISAGNFFYTSYSFLGYSYDVDYSEGFVLEDTERLLEEGKLYVEPKLENGFESVKYPPLYYLILAGFTKIFGLSFFTGRLVSILFALSSLMLIYLISREKSDLKFNFVPLIFLSTYLTVFTATTLRTDMIALTFSLLGLYLFFKEKIIPSAFILSLSAFTKHSFISAFLAVSLYLLMETDWKEQYEKLSKRDFDRIFSDNREFFIFNSFFVVTTVSLLSMTSLWSGQFLTNILYANAAGFEIRWDLISWIHITMLPILSLGVYYLYIFRDNILGLYIGFSLIIAFLQMLRGGAWVYAMIEPFAVSIICVSILYSRLKPYRKFITSILIIQALIFLSAPMMDGNIFDMKNIVSENEQGDQIIHEAVKEDKSFVEHAGYSFQTDKEYSPEIWSFYEQYSSGRINDKEALDFFKQKNYSNIIYYKRLDRLPLEEYIEENYELSGTVSRKDSLLHEEKWRIYTWKN